MCGMEMIQIHIIKMVTKKWYDDWNITHHFKGNGTYTLDLPHARESLHVEFSTKTHGWRTMKLLLDLLDSALYNLTQRDKDGR